jgi:hypothetical protein
MYYISLAEIYMSLAIFRSIDWFWSTFYVHWQVSDCRNKLFEEGFWKISKCFKRASKNLALDFLSNKDKIKFTSTYAESIDLFF